MQLRLIAVDKLRTRHVAEGCAEFRKRLMPYYPYDEIEVRAGDGDSPSVAMRDEADRILKLLRPDDRMWLLDRAGAQLNSPALSRRLLEVDTTGITRLTFVVAGTYGADISLRERSEFLWSLSELTFPHEWARMIVLEQLYRSAKIARNEPYHH